ncbi:hypothetical protein VV11_023920 [Trichodesmium erythraeum 21-75]|nr:hypothetical protein [Trichodesmium erythraeum 21-75]
MADEYSEKPSLEKVIEQLYNTNSGHYYRAKSIDVRIISRSKTYLLIH